MANRRNQIIEEFVRLFKNNLNGNSPYITRSYDNVFPRLIFWDEVNDYPTICIYAGSETREYLPGDFKWAFLSVNIRFYVDGEDAKEQIENLFVDIETLLDANNTITINNFELCTDIRILSISDDEGLLSPKGVGEMVLEVRYEV